MSSSDGSSSTFGRLLERLRLKLGLDLLDFTVMCQQSGEVELRKMKRGSVAGYELGQRFPHPGRAAALARVLESPHLLQVYQEERKPQCAYWWIVEAGLEGALKDKPWSEERRQQVSDFMKGRPMSEACRQALKAANTARPKTEADRRARSERLKGHRLPEAAYQARIIQDQFTHLPTAQERFAQRKRWRREQAKLEERLKLASQRPVWSPPEGWGEVEPWDGWGVEIDEPHD
jgi:hypothetical protein